MYRNNCNLTLEEVATRLGISKPTLQRYESGVISNIPHDKIEAMATIFGITPSQLMGWDKLKAEQIFINYLSSIGYQFEYISAKENKEGILEEYKNGGYVNGTLQLPDNNRRLPSLKKSDDKRAIFTVEEFNNFQKNIKESIDYQIWLKNK
jgi:transcriptional regulator with XRE-family HTH domain